MRFYNSQDPFGMESGFMAKQTSQKELEDEIAAFKKHLNQ